MTVHLVGAGPGDPGLITVRGAELLRVADVVVYDRLAEPSLLDLAPAAALRIDVGKRPGGPVRQDEINALLVEHGRSGRTVVRLKGGDPFVLGRGGEEAEVLIAAGVPFEVVPGITSAVAAPAYAGIPVTHRGLSTSFTVVTGHSRHGIDHEIDWHHLAGAGDTIIVLMGVAHRGEIAERLIAGGRAADTPVAAIRWGTRSDQRTVRTTLAGLGAATIEPPAAIVIGEVAGLDLGWFERRPLFGRGVVVTRARAQAPTLVRALEAAGADVVVVPTIGIEEPADGGRALAEAASRLSQVAWVAFTSTNAVDALFAHVRDARALGAASVAAVGTATADALRGRGIVPDLVASPSTAAGLAAAFPQGDGSTVLLPQADRAAPTLADGLAAKGWSVVAVDAYRTVSVPVDSADLARAAAAGAICFGSGSSVEAWLAAAGAAATPAVVVTIGPSTSAACRAAGLEPTAEAAEPTVDALVAAVIASVQQLPPG